MWFIVKSTSLVSESFRVEVVPMQRRVTSSTVEQSLLALDKCLHTNILLEYIIPVH